MKPNKLILFLNVIFISIIHSYSQIESSGIIYYESAINAKKMDEYISNKRKNIKDKKLIESMDVVFLNTKSIKSTLLFSKNEGLFEVENSLNIDKNDLAQSINKISAGSDKKFYYNSKTNTFLIKDCGSLGECFIYDNKLFEWQLTQESKVINNYRAYKATRSKGNIVAWYTPEIPIGFGPKGEYGLPGLILELEVGNVIFRATKIILNTEKKVEILKPNGGKRVSFEEYKEILHKAKKSVFGN
jgi:GLPGLI family protein